MGDLAAIARACDANGFLYVAVCDHVAIPAALAPKMGTSWWDTMTTLGYLAGITTDVRLMSHVYVLPYRHPLMTAKAFLTLDEVSEALAELAPDAAPTKRQWSRISATWRPLLDKRIADLVAVRDNLDSCIGCGCLSMRQCTLFNPQDELAATGTGPRRKVAILDEGDD